MCARDNLFSFFTGPQRAPPKINFSAVFLLLFSFVHLETSNEHDRLHVASVNAISQSLCALFGSVFTVQPTRSPSPIGSGRLCMSRFTNAIYVHIKNQIRTRNVIPKNKTLIPCGAAGAASILHHINGVAAAACSTFDMGCFVQIVPCSTIATATTAAKT